MEKNYKRTEIYEKKRKDTKYMFVWLCDFISTDVNIIILDQS